MGEKSEVDHPKTEAYKLQLKPFYVPTALFSLIWFILGNGILVFCLQNEPFVELQILGFTSLFILCLLGLFFMAKGAESVIWVLNETETTRKVFYLIMALVWGFLKLLSFGFLFWLVVIDRSLPFEGVALGSFTLATVPVLSGLWVGIRTRNKRILESA